ncbi:MAG: FliH/SctL family protein [Desulfobacterales bacterium]
MSPDSGESLSLNRENAFQLHYFPEIPLDGTDSCRTARGEAVHVPSRGFVRDGGDASWRDFAPNDTLPPGLAGQSRAEIETQAYIRGFNKGEKAGFDAAAEKIESLKALVSEAAEALRRAQLQLQREVEQEIVELALAVAGRVVGHEVKTSRDGIAAVVGEALQRVENQDAVVIKINPADIDFLDRLQLPLTGFFSNPDAVTIEADESVGAGGCVIETGGGDIDARLESRLRVVEEAFRKKLRQQPPEKDHPVSDGRVKA